jgi:rhamnose utilization protein RhaD (predicted bifunctional aldolase and dehydrogenase)
MWVKGSGGDIGTLTRKGIAGLYTERLRNLKKCLSGLSRRRQNGRIVQSLYFRSGQQSAFY